MDKAVILARGLGTRMRKEDDNVSLTERQREIASAGVKALIPIGRPFLDYVLNALADAGYRHICLVIGPEHHKLRTYYGETLSYERLNITFATQIDPLGTADAVIAAEDFVARESFLVINSDNYYPVRVLQSLRQIDEQGLAAFERDSLVAHSNIPAERLTRFAVVESDDKGYMKRIIEKPNTRIIETLPKPVSVSMNCWRFNADIFQACRSIDPSPRGELELPAAVQYAIDKLGQSFRIVQCKDAVLDMTSREDIEPVRARLTGLEVHL